MDIYINSTKVLNFIQDCLNHEDKIFDTEKATLIAIQRYIERAQIKDVAPVVHGYWIEGEKTYRYNWGSITVHQCNCSQCGYTQESSIWGGGISDSIKKTKYCPNCGAQMDGESNV